MIERPRGGWSGADRHGGLMLPDPRDFLERGIRIIWIQIDDRLEQHERHAVESNRIVAEPTPRQLRVLPAAEAILRSAAGIGVIQIALDRVVSLLDLGCPIPDHLPIHPRHDVVARIVRQRSDQSRGSRGHCCCRCLGRRALVASLAAAPAHEKADEYNADQWSDRDGHLKSPRHCRPQVAKTDASYPRRRIGERTWWRTGSG